MCEPTHDMSYTVTLCLVLIEDRMHSSIELRATGQVAIWQGCTQAIQNIKKDLQVMRSCHIITRKGIILHLFMRITMKILSTVVVIFQPNVHILVTI